MDKKRLLELAGIKLDEDTTYELNNEEYNRAIEYLARVAVVEGMDDLAHTQRVRGGLHRGVRGWEDYDPEQEDEYKWIQNVINNTIGVDIAKITKNLTKQQKIALTRRVRIAQKRRRGRER